MVASLEFFQQTLEFCPCRPLTLSAWNLTSSCCLRRHLYLLFLHFYRRLRVPHRSAFWQILLKYACIIPKPATRWDALKTTPALPQHTLHSPKIPSALSERSQMKVDSVLAGGAVVFVRLCVSDVLFVVAGFSK